MYKFDTNIPIILASTSPRRRELLQQIGVSHTCMSVSIDETQLAHENPIDYIQRMVSQKAKAALLVLPKNLSDCIVITADTIGVLADGEVLQKPRDYADACTMWQQMSNNTHQVWTAVQVSRVHFTPSHWQMTKHENVIVKTEVNFIELTQSMMQHYWQTTEPQDKAGGYAIQGLGAAWVKSINGSYSNVVGLPLVETVQLIQKII